MFVVCDTILESLWVAGYGLWADSGVEEGSAPRMAWGSAPCIL